MTQRLDSRNNVGIAGGALLIGIALGALAVLAMNGDLDRAAPEAAAGRAGLRLASHANGYQAIATATEAISRALEVFPASPSDQVAKLLTRLHAEEYASPSFTQPTEDYDAQYDGRPVWLVGLRASGLNEGDIAGGFMGGHASTGTIVGLYYIIDASNGLFASEGAIVSEARWTELENLPEDPVTPVAATPIVWEGTPEPTWTADASYDPTATPTPH